jgi:hypothetical protein
MGVNMTGEYIVPRGGKKKEPWRRAGTGHGAHERRESAG